MGGEAVSDGKKQTVTKTLVVVMEVSLDQNERLREMFDGYSQINSPTLYEFVDKWNNEIVEVVLK